MKKLLSIILIVAQVISISVVFTENSYALTEEELISLDLYNKTKDELQAKVNGVYVISDTAILEYLNTIGGLPLASQNRNLNPSTFRNYKVVAYGNPFGDKYETFKIDPNMKTIEYRYLGYNKEGYKISNDQFANDFSTTSLPTTRNFQTYGDAKETWSKIANDIAQRYKLLQEDVLNDDVRENEYIPTTYSVSDLLGVKIGEYTSYVQLMLSPTYLQEGVLRLWHKGKKGIYYDTMRTTPIDNMNISTTISVDSPSITFKASDTETKTLNLTVKSNVNIYPNYGQNETRYVKKITQTISDSTNGFTVDVFKNTDLAINRPLLDSDTTFSIPINIPPTTLKDGESKTFTFKAKTQVTTAYENTFTSNVATIDVVVSKGIYVAPSSANVDFKIFINGVDYTDSVYKVADLNFTTPVNVVLKDASSLSGINSDFFYWYNNKTGTPALMQAGDTSLKEYSFTINSTNKSTYLDGNNDLSFALKIKASNGDFYDSLKHKVNMLYVPAPVVEIPHSVLFAQTKTQQEFSEINVTAGEKIELNGSRSYTKDPTATIVGYNFVTSGFTKKSESTKVKKGYFDKVGTYYQKLTVTDSKGQTSGESEVRVNVTEPNFNLKINYTGNLKENRKVTFDLNQSDIPSYYPLDKSTLKWTITPLDGGNQINNGLLGKDVIETQYLKKGRYKVRVEGNIKSLDPSNSKTYSSSDEIIIDIVEDKVPIVEFAVNKYKIRDAEDGNKVLVSIIDKSYSPDGDELDYATLSYRYDSNDNGIYTDENEVVVTTSFNNSIELLLNQNVVGKFRFYLSRSEKSSTDCLQWFAESYRKSNSDVTMVESEKILEILNVAPTVVLDVDSVKTIDYVIATDYEGDQLLNLKSELEKLEAELLSKKIKPNFVFYDGKSVIGTKNETKYRFIQKGYFTFNYDYDSVNGSSPNQTYTQDFDWFTYDLWESDIDKLPKINTTGVGFTKLPQTNEYGDGWEKIYQHYKLYGAGKEVQFDFRSHSYNDRTGSYNVYYDIRNQNFRLDTYYSKVALETASRTLYSIDFDGLKSELDKYNNPVLIILQNNKYSTATTSNTFLDFMKSKDITIYTDIENMSNPTGLEEVDDIYYLYNKSNPTNKYYIRFKSGRILEYDPSLGLTVPVDELPSLAISNSRTFQDIATELGGVNSFFGAPDSGNWRYLSQETLNSLYQQYGKKLTYPYVNVPYVVNGNMYRRTGYWNVTSNTNSVNKYFVDYKFYDEYLRGNVKEVVYYDDLYILYTDKNNVLYSMRATDLDIAILSVPYTSIEYFHIIDDVNKKVYDRRGIFKYDFVSRDENYIKLANGTGVNLMDLNFTFKPTITDAYGVATSSGYEQSQSFIYDGYIYNRQDYNKGSSYPCYEGPLYYTQGYYRYGSRYGDGTLTNLITAHIAESDSKYLVLSSFAQSTGYYYYATYFKYYDKDSISHVFPFGDTSFLSTGKGIYMTKTSLSYAQKYNNSYTVMSATINRIPNTIDFSEVFGANASNKLVTDLTTLADTINSATETPYYNKTAYILLGSTLESSMLYADYENDPIRDMKFDFIHDETVFDNGLGKDPSSGVGLSQPLTKFDYVGLYTGKLHIWDKPNLLSYSRENEDNTEIKIYVHRKPFALGKWKLVKNGGENYIRLEDNGSYDLDHQSQAGKGIAKYKWFVNGTAVSESSTFDFKVTDTTYNVQLRVQDVEGEWSEPYDISIDLGKILLSAVLRETEIPVGDNVSITNIMTQYLLSAVDTLKIELIEGVSQLDSETLGSSYISSSTDIEQIWRDYNYMTDVSLIDKTLFFRLQASKDGVLSNIVDLPFKVIMDNQPPVVDFTLQTPNPVYEGDDIINKIIPDDPDGDLLKIEYYVQKPGGSYLLFKTYTNVLPGEEFELDPVLNAEKGIYNFKVIASDGNLDTEKTKQVSVNSISISATLLPSDPMAGDMLYFNVSTIGHIDRIEVILEDDIVDNDRRVQMGYSAVNYVGNSIFYSVSNPSQLNNSLTCEYIAWITTPQSLTLKGIRNRPIYTFKVVGYRGDRKSNTITITREIQGNVRQTLKSRTTNKRIN